MPDRTPWRRPNPRPFAAIGWPSLRAWSRLAQSAVTASLLAVTLAAGARCAAQEAPPVVPSPADPTTPAPPVTPPETVEITLNEEQKALVQQFIDARRTWAETLAEMRRLEIRYSNDVDRAPETMERFAELRNRARGEMRALFAVAQKLYAELGNDAESGRFLLRTIEYRQQKSMYEDSYDAARLLIDSGIPVPALYAFAARCAFLEGRFDEVLPLYKRFVETEGPDKLEQVDQQLGGLLEPYPQWWAEETAIREAEAKADDLPRVLLETTRGPVVLELFENNAPNTVANFIRLVEDGFYDDSEFYQVIDDLLAMGGDPVGDGSGTSGKFLPDEHDRADRRRIFRGSIFMAKRSEGESTGRLVPNTASCQFVIALMPMAPQDPSQTVFGRVIEGMDVVCSFRRLDPSEKKDAVVVLPPDRIVRASVIRKRDHDYPVTYAP
jgi:cyclophilin family peptidyl-prolyl cis-trans isomerase